MVAVSVASNQVLIDGELRPSWLYLSGGVALMTLLYAEWFSPDSSVGPQPASPAVRRAARGRRGAYLRQLRESVHTMETVGVATQGEFVLDMKQAYVDVSLAPQPPHNTASEPYIGHAATSV